MRMNAEIYYVANSSFGHIFLRHAFGLRVLGSKPNQSFQPGNSNTDSRCPASVILQGCKTERTYKYNRTATAQQYRYSSIVQFSSIKNRENLQINSTATVQQYRYTSIEPFSSISTRYCIQQYHPPPGQLTHTESLLYHRGQVESDVSNRNFSLRNKSLVQIIKFGTQKKIL